MTQLTDRELIDSAKRIPSLYMGEWLTIDRDDLIRLIALAERAVEADEKK